MNKKMRLFPILLVIFLIVQSCNTIEKTIVQQLELPNVPDRPIQMYYNNDLLIKINPDDHVVEADYYIIANPRFMDDYKHNFLVIMSYSTRLEDWIIVTKELNNTIK